ncbi:FecR family protein [Dyadobacter sp. SG02]|uniref:FecR family protein n=1 Tax=Dyadobacter sp. SG02 TaxID=1855291 RepID=UPI0008D21EF8|nr:FecR family protein [Dyadobacter sp. SG02]SEJ48856.1 FecR family protein [Dyadobacter sp. SG02]
MDAQKYDQFSYKDFVLDDDFRAWLNGTAPENDHQWEHWLQANPSRHPEIEKARKIVLALHFQGKPVPAYDIEQQWKRLESSIAVSDVQKTVADPPRRLGLRRVFKLLAAACVLTGAFFLANRYLTNHQAPASAYAPVESKTANGQQRKLVLPDGTRVTLNAGSAISYPEAFEGNIRKVTLTGEAFFDVVRNEKAAFVITTGDVVTKVLGTSFNIRAYPENKAVQVAVVSGKVKVNARIGSEDQNACVFLSKSEMATFQQEAGELIVSTYDEKEQIGWKDGMLYFQKSDFKSTILKLERWYGVKFEVAPGVRMDADWRFSGKFQEKPLDYILGVMSYPNRFSYKVNDSIVKLQ